MDAPWKKAVSRQISDALVTQLPSSSLEFANKDSSDITVQRRKWKAGLLKNLIDNISSDCLQGLLALMEFWLSIGKVEDCPQSFPDRGNKESIQKYFTQSLYTSNLCRNRCWLKKEIKDIIRLESWLAAGMLWWNIHRSCGQKIKLSGAKTVWQ